MVFCLMLFAILGRADNASTSTPQLFNSQLPNLSTPSYTNHAGNVVSGAVIALDVRTATISNATETVTTTEVLWQRILTNDTSSVTNTYAGQVVYTPPPPWLLASEGWITNTTSRTVSRLVKTGETLALTNSLASITCSSGLGSAIPTNAWLLSGERVVTSGTAKGKVFLVLER